MLAPGGSSCDHDNNDYEDNGGYHIGADIWDFTDKPLHKIDHRQDGGDKYPHVGSTPTLHFMVLII
jgi:hypothetical protein